MGTPEVILILKFNNIVFFKKKMSTSNILFEFHKKLSKLIQINQTIMEIEEENDKIDTARDILSKNQINRISKCLEKIRKGIRFVYLFL